MFDIILCFACFLYWIPAMLIIGALFVAGLFLLWRFFYYEEEEE